MKVKYLFVSVCCSLASMSLCGQINKDYKEPIMLKTTDGQPIIIETGSCAPLLRDMDHDGVMDLLLGEFGSIPCPGQEKVRKGFVEGRCRMFKGVAGNGGTQYLPYEWLQSENKPLYVPITCCMPMAPTFADVNGDGLEDLVSGCYPGDLYWWPAQKDGTWGKRSFLLDKQGQKINVGNAATVFATGNKGFLINTLYDGLYWVENQAAEKEPMRLTIHPKKISTKSGKEIDATYAVSEDIDGDGLSDLVYGLHDMDGFGNIISEIRWCKNYENEQLGDSHPLIKIDGERFVELNEKVEKPGEKIRFCFYDVNGDGKKDIVVTTETSIQHRRTFTPEQLEIKEKLEKERRALYDKWGKMRDKVMKKTGVPHFTIGRVPYDKLPSKMAEKSKVLDEACIDISYKTSPYEEYYSSNTGFVWLFIHK